MAFCRAKRTTLVGSMMPSLTMFIVPDGRVIVDERIHVASSPTYCTRAIAPSACSVGPPAEPRFGPSQRICTSAVRSGGGGRLAFVKREIEIGAANRVGAAENGVRLQTR